MFLKADLYPYPLEKWFLSDYQFNKLFPEEIRVLSTQHWTPLKIARLAANYLADESGVRILDIGSGVGKFCLSAAYFRPEAVYTGVEQRLTQVLFADEARHKLGFDNVHFCHGNFTQLDFNNYNRFYFFNSFYENLTSSDKIDDTINLSPEMFHYYTRFLYKQLEHTSTGTKLVTFHSLGSEVPSSFQLVDASIDGLLKYWLKIR